MHFSDVGWTDITATTAAAGTVLRGARLRDRRVSILSVPVTYAGLSKGDIDVFLGNWMPTMEADLAPHRDDGSVEVLRPNLTGAKYTLAVNSSLADAGLKDFADIAKFGDQLDGTIYGIEAGNDGNRLILDMIDKDKFGLGKLQAEGELGAGDAGRGEAGGEERQGDRLPRLGAAPDEHHHQDDLPDRRRRGLRAGLRRRHGLHQRAQGLCRGVPERRQAPAEPRVFTLPMESEIMGKILDDGEDPDEAAAAWLTANPDILGELARRGDDARRSGDGLAAVRASLGV